MAFRLDPVERRVYHVEGRRVHARVARGPPGEDGSGLPVVLVHGQVVSSRYMAPLAERLAPRRRVLAPDLPGYGLSEDPGYPLDVEGLADALARFLDAAGVARAALVGNSFGCQVIAELALRHPERVACGVLQGPTSDPEARSVARQAWRWARNAAREPPSLGLVLALDYMDAGPRRALATFRLLLDDPIEEKLPRVRQPMLVLRGDRDPIVPQAWAERAAALLPRGRLVVLPGVPHTANYTAPDLMAEAVLEFVARQEGAAS